MILELHDGCHLSGLDNFTSGERQFTCPHRRTFKIRVRRPQEIQYDVTEVTRPTKETTDGPGLPAEDA